MPSPTIMTAAVLCLGLALASAGHAQGTNVAFAGLKTDISQPVQVDADQLSVNQETGTATFSGNVVVVQGDMRLQAGEVTITYSADNRAIQSLRADGGVTLAAGTDAATADSAEYSPDTGDLVLIGKVVLTQGAAALSGEKLTLSLKSGTGTMSGRVTTIFTPGND
jgi:lipopolysaccharide export system protein LptA